MQPAARAVATDCAAKLAAPRAEFAFPPRSREAARRERDRRGDRGGQHVQPAHQQTLSLDLGVAERRALLGVPVDAFLHRVDVDECQHVPARQQRGTAGFTFSTCSTLPQVKARRNDPSVDGARIPPNSAGMAPCRRRSGSSMLSAPPIIPATRQATFRSGFTPHG